MLKIGDPIPPFDIGTRWVGDASCDASASDRPVLVHFWTTGCPLCHEGARTIARLRKRFAATGLIAIAVFQPRLEEQPELARVENDARSLMGIDYPCAFDVDRALERAFGSEYTPTYWFFDFDAVHRLRHRHMGNAGFAMLETVMAAALEPAHA